MNGMGGFGGDFDGVAGAEVFGGSAFAVESNKPGCDDGQVVKIVAMLLIALPPFENAFFGIDASAEDVFNVHDS